MKLFKMAAARRRFPVFHYRGKMNVSDMSTDAELVSLSDHASTPKLSREVSADLNIVGTKVSADFLVRVPPVTLTCLRPSSRTSIHMAPTRSAFGDFDQLKRRGWHGS